MAPNPSTPAMQESAQMPQNNPFASPHAPSPYILPALGLPSLTEAQVHELTAAFTESDKAYHTKAKSLFDDSQYELLTGFKKDGTGAAGGPFDGKVLAFNKAGKATTAQSALGESL